MMIGEGSGEIPSEPLLATGDVLREYLGQHASDTDTAGRMRTVFGGLLADRLGDGRDPVGYVFAAEFLIDDCIRGVDATTQEPLPSPVALIDPAVGHALRAVSIGFAQGAFGPSFADEVRAAWNPQSDHE